LVILFVVIYTIFVLVAEFTVLLFVQLTVNSRYCTLVLLYKISVQLTVNSRVRLFFEYYLPLLPSFCLYPMAAMECSIVLWYALLPRGFS
jgi:hypothetical protein